MFWPKMSDKVVIGRVFVPAPGSVTRLHGKQLELDTVKVMADIPLIADSTLPYPTEEVKTIIVAMNCPVAWPKSMVVIISVM